MAQGDNTGGAVQGSGQVRQRELTYGERAVGLTFNPSGDPNVNEAKRLFGQIIDLCANMRSQSGSPEQARLLSVAITEAQSAQMWAVKGITWKD